MKKSLLYLSVACFLFLSMITVHADVLIELENSFFQKNRENCVLLGRNFRTNSESDKVDVKNAPNSKLNVASFENGKIIYIEYSCLYNGEYWGITTYGEKEHDGWVKMNQLLAMYDYTAFEEDHLSELYQYIGDFAEIKETRKVVAWTWPGSGNTLGAISDIDVGNFSVSYTYRDEQGREWGFVPYLFGSRNFWICISEPDNRDIPVFNPEPEPTNWQTETVHTEIGETDNMIIFVILLVMALVVLTATLIKVFWKKEEGKK